MSKYQRQKKYRDNLKQKGFKAFQIFLSAEEVKDLDKLMITHGLKSNKQAYKFLMDSYRFLFQMEQK